MEEQSFATLSLPIAGPDVVAFSFVHRRFNLSEMRCRSF